MQKVQKKENLGVRMENCKFGMVFTMEKHVHMHTHIYTNRVNNSSLKVCDKGSVTT
jgi:hypothetical protein